MQASILAEMCHSDHESLLHMLVGGPGVRTVVSREMIGRLMIQCARYPAVSEFQGGLPRSAFVLVFIIIR